MEELFDKLVNLLLKHRFSFEVLNLVLAEGWEHPLYGHIDPELYGEDIRYIHLILDDRVAFVSEKQPEKLKELFKIVENW